MAGGAAMSALAIAPPKNANTYDTNNRLTQVTYADGRQVSYTYDAMGNLLTVKTRLGAPPIAIVGEPIEGSIGIAITDYQIQANRPADVTGYMVSGLPAGLKANTTLLVNTDGKAPGTIYGTPTVGGAFSIIVTLKGASGTGTPSTVAATISNPFPITEDGFSLTGIFSGAIDPSSITGGNLGGWLIVTTTAGGSFTGTLQLGALKYPIKGAFDSQTGVAPGILITRKSPLPNLTLNLGLVMSGSNRGQVAGTLVEGVIPPVPVQINREVWSTTNLAGLYGGTVSARYNIAMDVEVAHQASNTYPQGFGYAALTVMKNGTTTLAGVMQDGATITLSKVLWPDGTLPVFIPLYSNLGVLNGSLLIDVGADYATTDNSIAGSMFWKRPASTKVGDRFYPGGFETNVDAGGGAYTPPATGYRVLNLGNGAAHTTEYLRLDDGSLLPGLQTAITIATANKVTAFTPNDHTYSLTFTPTTGVFTGKFTMPSPTRSTSFNGLIVPDMLLGTTTGYGYFLLPGPLAADPILSGGATLAP